MTLSHGGRIPDPFLQKGLGTLVLCRDSLLGTTVERIPILWGLAARCDVPHASWTRGESHNSEHLVRNAG